MPITKLSPAYLKEFDEKVQQAVKKFPEVVRVRYNFDEDWTGEPAIYFRVVLSDDLGLGERFIEAARRVEGAITGDLQLYESEYFPFFYFRLKSEEDRLKEPSWE
ncbi:hypothetical protein SBA4_220026 [Candidatus Sulfopaludibacter sp. SbA4]|nr:hypothetical protein SBA4_220026 [Candidatus Sulfopaludibacter sp. SbA4]